MPNDILLGSEVIIVPINDARRLVNALLKSRDGLEQLQRLGALSMLGRIGDAVRRYDYDKWERTAAQRIEADDA